MPPAALRAWGMRALEKIESLMPEGLCCLSPCGGGKKGFIGLRSHPGRAIGGAMAVPPTITFRGQVRRNMDTYDAAAQGIARTFDTCAFTGQRCDRVTAEAAEKQIHATCGLRTRGVSPSVHQAFPSTEEPLLAREAQPGCGSPPAELMLRVTGICWAGRMVDHQPLTIPETVMSKIRNERAPLE